MFIFMQNLRHSKKGFTLIEMLVVIAIIAILVAIIIPVVGASTAKAAAATNAANLRAVEGQLITMRLLNPEQFETWATVIRSDIGNEFANFLQSLVNLGGNIFGVGNLGDAIDKRLRTTTAVDGVLSLPVDPMQMDVPPAQGVTLTVNNKTYEVAKGTQMSVYINDDTLVCHYNGYTKEDFAAIAEGRKPPVIEEEESGGGGTNPCITPDTLITLADGTAKPVAELTGDEQLLVWNHETGALDAAPVAYLIDHDRTLYEIEVIAMHFANGETLNIIGEHVFYDADLNRYVPVTSENADSFVGHSFAALSGTGLELTELVSIERTTEVTELYEVVSYGTMTCFTENILSSCAYLDVLLNTFAIDPETMAYDAAAKAADLEAYGLLDYELLSAFLSEEVFEMHNGETAGVALQKGSMTVYELFELIEFYNKYVK